MKALVVYDSMFGNTEKIANAIGGALSGDVKILRVGDANPSDAESMDLVIVGSPTQGFRASEPIQAFIKSIPGSALKGIDAAAFDTRIAEGDVGSGLRLFMKIGGYAALRIAKSLKKKGGNLVAPSEGFFVKDKEGPLKEGELERAGRWAEKITSESETVE